MLRWVIFAVAVVVLTAAATFGVLYLPDSETGPKVPVNTSTGPQPKLEIGEELIYDFGKMPQHETNTHTWQIKNVGEANLDVWMVGKPTCSCTIAKLEHGEKAVVKPGDSTTIQLDWNTKDFERDDYSQGATFGTNDPNRPTFQLTVKGKVHPAVVVYPPEMITFRTISNEETHRTRIGVWSQDRPEMKLTKLATSKPGLIVATSIPMTPEETKQFKIEAGHTVIVEVKPGMPQGRFHEELVIQTDHPKQSEVRVSVAGDVTGPISVFPAWLRMNVPSRQGGSAKITLLVRGDKETRFEVAHKPEKAQVAIEREDTPTLKGRYIMTVTVPPGTSAGPVEDQIVLKTDHPRVSELKIRVNILISRSVASAS